MPIDYLRNKILLVVDRFKCVSEIPKMKLSELDFWYDGAIDLIESEKSYLPKGA